MQIKERELLAPYTTFKIGGPARYFCVVENQFDALEAYEFAEARQLEIFVLGGGSNILVSDKGFDGLVIKVVNKGIEVINNNHKDDGEVLLKVASGEVWDEVVKFSVKNNWWGIENLSHIPGSTGAIAVQNVGAYGQEAKNVIESVTVFERDTHQILNLEAKDCGFAYRQSIFNSSQKGKYIIFEITFKLSKSAAPNLEYRDLKLKFANKSPSLQEIRQAVIEIRDKKFPFPVEAKKGNAGSFFKNPIVSLEDLRAVGMRLGLEAGPKAAEDLSAKVFKDGDQFKIPAAFLLDVCGLKNLQSGGAAINPNQPLVIVNQSGQATSADVLNLAEQVRGEVAKKTGLFLIFEPELIGF